MTNVEVLSSINKEREWSTTIKKRMRNEKYEYLQLLIESKIEGMGRKKLDSGQE